MRLIQMAAMRTVLFSVALAACFPLASLGSDTDEEAKGQAGTSESAGEQPQVCSEHSGRSYGLDWSAQGHSFFSDFDFLVDDLNHGAAQYLSLDEALSEGVVEPHETHALLRIGTKGWMYKRKSAKIATKRSWQYFLITMRFSHVPWGCSVWPGFWMNAVGVEWPNGGELDILEWADHSPGFSSLHVGEGENHCRLSQEEINKPGCPQMLSDQEYDCTTAYPDKLGCAPNREPHFNGKQWAEHPGVVAVESTPEYAKVFYIPEGSIPKDLQADAPRPDEWDQWLMAYFPFAASERRNPGSCPKPGGPLMPQQFILNIGLCGDWASKVWDGCTGEDGWSPMNSPTQCRIVDPLFETDPGGDCCTQFVWDESGTFGADDYLRERAYFNISWIKVYVEGAPAPAPAATTVTAHPPAPEPTTSELAVATSTPHAVPDGSSGPPPAAGPNASDGAAATAGSSGNGTEEQSGSSSRTPKSPTTSAEPTTSHASTTEAKAAPKAAAAHEGESQSGSGGSGVDAQPGSNSSGGSTSQDYNCQVGEEETRKSWPIGKKVYCCLIQGLGCAPTPLGGRLNASIPTNSSGYGEGSSDFSNLTEAEQEAIFTGGLYSPGASKIRWARKESLCVDVVDHGTRNGTLIQLWECLLWDTDQVFSFPTSGSGKIRWSNNPHMCLDVTDHSTAHGTRIQLWQCLDGDVDQEFECPGVGTGTAGRIRWKSHPSMCLGAVPHHGTGGVPSDYALQLVSCDDNSSHSFILYGDGNTASSGILAEAEVFGRPVAPGAKKEGLLAAASATLALVLTLSLAALMAARLWHQHPELLPRRLCRRRDAAGAAPLVTAEDGVADDAEDETSGEA